MSWAEDQIVIARLVSDFVLRDRGEWDRLKDLFHRDGRIQVSWFVGAFPEFVEASAKLAKTSPAASKHWMGVSRIDIAGDRAVSDTDVIIMIRFALGGVDVDVTSFARFHDRIERRLDQRWRILERVCIYERDRVDPVHPNVIFDEFWKMQDFSHFPASYRHLATVLSAGGAPLVEGQISAGTPEEKALFAASASFLGAG